MRVYVTEMGDDMRGERLPADSHVDAVKDTARARIICQEVAHKLHDHGLCRPGATIDFHTPCPDETKEDAEGLC